MKVATIVLVLLIVAIVLVLTFIQLNKVADISVEQLKPRWANEASRFIDVEGMAAHVRIEGPKDAKSTIVLLHGTGASLHTWDGWSETLRRHYRVVRFDLPAFGLTGPEPSNNYTIERYQQVVVAVMDKLGIEQAILAGNSLGGYIAWATAVLAPDKVSHLILVDASGYPYDSASVPLAFKLSQNPLTKTLLKNFITKSIVRSSVENVYGDPSKVTEELVERYYQLTLRAGNRAALKERFVQTQPGPLMNSIPGITVPTLILWGAKDELIPVKFAHRFDSEITASKLVIFDELGHVPHEEAPAETLVPVMEFLSVNATERGQAED